MGENKYNFQKLTPIKNVDMTLYCDALDYVFDNSDIRNVAISGAYGAGKSSVLESYKEKNKDLRFIHISLAHFRRPIEQQNIKDDFPKKDSLVGVNNVNSPQESTDEVIPDIKESTLEGKILNQLIHQIPSSKIPQTNFRVKKRVSKRSLFISVVLSLIFLMSLLHLFLFQRWDVYVGGLQNSWLKPLLELSTNPYSLIISGIVCGIIFCILLWILIKTQKNKNIFRKVNVQGNEIEIFEECEDSYFDKYLNEVLYLFENTRADVIVFEDMDRFNANRIFERLREVNTIANVHLKKETKAYIKTINRLILWLRKAKLFSKIPLVHGTVYPIRFFYLLRDDIFISKDRTKFFDYIVPVVPVVDSSNSYDQFIAHFKQGHIYDLFNENFLQGLSLYVDDMRILKNIYNEFVVYYNRLNITELDCNKMLAMISYKNIFPRDFNDLQLNRGMVYSLFEQEQKEEFIENEIGRLRLLAEQKRTEIEQVKKEHLESIQELDDAYSLKRSRLPSSYQFQQKKKELSEKYDTEYSARKLALENIQDESLPLLEQELSKLEHDIITTQSKPLKEVINRNNIDDIFKITTTNEIGKVTDFNEIKGSDYFGLLKYLIRNGYIDESYADYMTYFYENSLSRIDKTFLRSITDKKAKEPTYQLKNKSLVVERLKLVDFDQEEILNFDLMEYLLKTASRDIYLDRFIQQLEDTKNFKFIGTYFDTKRELPAFVKSLNSHWPGLFSYALKHSELMESQLRQYSILTIYYSEDDNIQQVNSDDCLTVYISNKSDYLNISEPNVKRLIHVFKMLGVSFISIEPEDVDTDLFKDVYNHSLYQMNFSNIKLMLNSFYSTLSEDDIQHKNYSIITSLPQAPLLRYVNQNISTYLDVILDNSNGHLTDDENVVLLIINNEEITNEQKARYIEQLATTITSISNVTDKELWSFLLDNRTAAYSVNNIIAYFGDSVALDSTLVNYIDSKEEFLDFSIAEGEVGNDKLEKLFDAIVICDELSNSKYSEMLKNLGFYYDSFSVTGISTDKMRILIETFIIRMTAESLIFIREHYPSESLYFIKRNINKYSDMMNSGLFNLDELKAILTWEITDEIKIGLLGFTQEPLTVLNINYSPSVVAYILLHNLLPEDRFELFSLYDEWESIVKIKIIELAITRIVDIIADSSTTSILLLKSLFASHDLTVEKKIDVFASSISRFSIAECKDILSTLELQEFRKLYEPRKRPSIKVSSTNQKLLTAFSNENVIDSFEEDAGKPGYYKINRSRHKSNTLPDVLL